jgi:hypothetical protein
MSDRAELPRADEDSFPNGCAACRFWRPSDGQSGIGPSGGNSGECRRIAPTRVLADAPDALAAFARNPGGEYDEDGEYEGLRRAFPLTYCWDWCGEWQARKPDRFTAEWIEAHWPELAKVLTRRESEIIKLRYGMTDDGSTYTLDETARIFKVTVARARQIEAKAIKKITAAANLIR